MFDHLVFPYSIINYGNNIVNLLYQLYQAGRIECKELKWVQSAAEIKTSKRLCVLKYVDVSHRLKLSCIRFYLFHFRRVVFPKRIHSIRFDEFQIIVLASKWPVFSTTSTRSHIYPYFIDDEHRYDWNLITALQCALEAFEELAKEYNAFTFVPIAIGALNASVFNFVVVHVVIIAVVRWTQTVDHI